jgi:DNA-binding NarL/FixJ family response regulator
MTSSRRGRIAIVDDHQILAESMALTLEVEGNTVRRIDVDEGTSLASILATLLRSMPKIVLLDLHLGPVGDSFRLIDPLTKVGIRVIVLTAESDQARWGECLRRGAVVVTAKTAPLNEVVSIVRRVNDGLQVITRQDRQDLIDLWQQDFSEVRRIRQRLGLLTASEREILEALMLGRPVRDIARGRVVSEATVRTQVKSILSKLEANSQLAAVGDAHRVGWRRTAQ